MQYKVMMPVNSFYLKIIKTESNYSGKLQKTQSTKTNQNSKRVHVASSKRGKMYASESSGESGANFFQPITKRRNEEPK